MDRQCHGSAISLAVSISRRNEVSAIVHGWVAVQEVTIAGNMRDMFKQIVAVGNDLELRSNIRTGSVLIERMTVAGS